MTSPVTDAASLISFGLATEPVVIRPKIQPARIARAKAAAAHCGVANGESNALSQFSRLARDVVSRLWIFDQTIALKSVGRSARGRLERAFRSSSKRDSFILLCRTIHQSSRSSYLLSRLNERKGLIPQNFGNFFHRQRPSIQLIQRKGVLASLKCGVSVRSERHYAHCRYPVGGPPRSSSAPLSRRYNLLRRRSLTNIRNGDGPEVRPRRTSRTERVSARVSSKPDRSQLITNFISNWANAMPMQRRTPPPKGKYSKGE